MRNSCSYVCMCVCTCKGWMIGQDESNTCSWERKKKFFFSYRGNCFKHPFAVDLVFVFCIFFLFFKACLCVVVHFSFFLFYFAIPIVQQQSSSNVVFASVSVAFFHSFVLFNFVSFLWSITKGLKGSLPGESRRRGVLNKTVS